MGKSLKNSVSPDEMYERCGADTLRLYGMAMGPLDTGRPWRTGDIAGVYRFLQRLWRSLVDEQAGQLRVSDRPLDHGAVRRLHQTIMIARRDFGGLRFNTAIARLMELTSHAAKIAATDGAMPRTPAEPLVLMAAPLAPHIAEELWSRLGHDGSLAFASRLPTRRSPPSSPLACPSRSTARPAARSTCPRLPPSRRPSGSSAGTRMSRCTLRA
jgi:leucyl-tRNA synthetase